MTAMKFVDSFDHILKYMDHTGECPSRKSPQNSCDCGLLGAKTLLSRLKGNYKLHATAAAQLRSEIQSIKQNGKE